MFLKVTENKNTIKGKSKFSKVTKDKINSGSKLKSNPGTRCLSLYQTNVRDSNKRIETHTCTHTWKTAGKQWKNSRKALSFPIKTFHLETFGGGKKSTRVETWTKFRQNFPVLDRARFSSCGCGDARGDEPVLQDIPSIEEKASYRQWLRLFNGDFLLLSLSLSLSLVLSGRTSRFLCPSGYSYRSPTPPLSSRFRGCNWIPRHHRLQTLLADLAELNFFHLLPTLLLFSLLFLSLSLSHSSLSLYFEFDLHMKESHSGVLARPRGRSLRSLKRSRSGSTRDRACVMQILLLWPLSDLTKRLRLFDVAALFSPFFFSRAGDRGRVDRDWRLRSM